MELPTEVIGDSRSVSLCGSAFELLRDPRMWVSLDGNFLDGGRSALNGIEGNDRQKNSRAGMTVSLRLSRHQTLKFSYSRGTYVTMGGYYRTVSSAWQYQWLDKANKRE